MSGGGRHMVGASWPLSSAWGRVVFARSSLWNCWKSVCERQEACCARCERRGMILNWLHSSRNVYFRTRRSDPMDDDEPEKKMRSAECASPLRYLEVSTIGSFCAAFLSFGVATAMPADMTAERLLTICEAPIIPPFLTGLGGRIHAAIFSFCAGVMPPMPMLGRSLL